MLCLTGVFGKSLWTSEIVNIKGFSLSANIIYLTIQIISTLSALVDCIPTMMKPAREAKEAFLACKYLTPLILNLAVVSTVPYFLECTKQYCLAFILIFGGSFVQCCWKFIISSCVGFNFNPFTLNSLLPAWMMIAIICLE